MLSIIGFLLGALISFTDHRKLVNQVARADSEIEAAINSYMDETEKSRDELVILWGYGVPSRCFALRYGNTSTEGAALTKEIDEICPGQWLYDVFGGFVELPTAYEPLSENRDWDIVILPERFLPSESTNLGRVVISDAQTQGYGNLVFLFALEDGD